MRYATFFAATLFFSIFFLQKMEAQSKNYFFGGVGAQLTHLGFSRDGSQALGDGGLTLIVQASGGDIDKVVPKRIRINTFSPQFFVGYHIQMEDLWFARFQLGTSQNFKETFRLRGTFAAQNKTYPIPNAICLAMEFGKTFYDSKFFFNGTIRYDDGYRDSEFLLSQGVNIKAPIVSALNNLGTLNLLSGAGQGKMQILIGGGLWVKSPVFNLRAMLRTGFAGKAWLNELCITAELHKKQ